MGYPIYCIQYTLGLGFYGNEAVVAAESPREAGRLLEKFVDNSQLEIEGLKFKVLDVNYSGKDANSKGVILPIIERCNDLEEAI